MKRFKIEVQHYNTFLIRKDRLPLIEVRDFILDILVKLPD